ncbi:glycosyl transferase [Xenococcus sp. PCC 7305]|uniref:glycosyltransferase family 2 protein n=1 Tax=Xenococcus sp. PCC 7305 TaxID=102125 RepID=UPI0002ABDBCB|nr:glycosyltransferase family 2 protein [Xenococcus sp. PCC 7305]ELS02167.1 glycosyl transferase [Xenococcus sp. PCC 7305]
MLEQITPLVLTYNEAPNIERTLQQLTWAKKIVVIDSYSTDETLNLLKQYPQVELWQRAFDTYAQQCNYGLEKVDSEWVLSLDADYWLTNELMAEIRSIPSTNPINSYHINFKYCIFGKPLRGTVLPPRQALYRKNCVTYFDDGHAHFVKTQGLTSYLKNYILHDDRKSLTRWLWAQDRYMIIEAEKLRSTPLNKLNLQDKIRKQKIFAPIIMFFYCLIIKGLIFDGWLGFYYTSQRVFVEILLAIHLIEKDLLEMSQDR